MTTEVERRIAAGDLGFVDADALAEFVLRRRWFGSKSREVLHVTVLDAVALRSQAPLLAAALLEVRFQPGTHDVYQVLLGFRPDEEEWEGDVIARAEGWTVYEALSDPVLCRELVHLVRGSTTVHGEEGSIDFHAVDGFAVGGAELRETRAIVAEQSNSSVVLDEELILKAYRRLEPGVNPELELLRFLTERDFPYIASLAGWYSFTGRLMEATLGILQQYVQGEEDGWAYALECLRDDPEAFHPQARRLGEVTGAMHVVLGSDTTDPRFTPEEASTEALGILTATIDEEIEQLFADLPDREELEPIAGRGEEVRERLRLLSRVAAPGRVIRNHGDYHLGQVLRTSSEWIVLDFEGEPARSLPDRRRKRSPLRDVAGMLRSFAYAASAAEVEQGVVPPADWEDRARSEFLAGYVPVVEPSGLLPPGDEALRRLLAVFELEKAVYELRYELDNRPDWVKIPVAGINRLLDADSPE
jgi:maltokinase